MAVNKVIYGNQIVIDITDSTVNPNTLLAGYKAYGANGEQVTGNVELSYHITLHKAQYDQLSEQEKLADENFFYIDDLDSADVLIDDTSTSYANTWSSNKIENELETVENMIAPVESDTTASQGYSTGDQFIFGGQLVRASADITEGQQIVEGSGGNCVSAKPIGEQIEFRTRSKSGSTITVEGGSYATTSCDFSSVMDEDESIISVMISGSGASNLVVRGTSISSRANVNASLKNVGTATITNATPGFRVVTVKAPWKAIV